MSRTQTVTASPRATSAHATFKIVVPSDVRRFFVDAVITGQGGYQSLCRMLSTRLRTSPVLHLDPDEFKRIVHYAADYGDGGFQSRLRKMVVAWVAQQTQQAA